ncbi:hypothetical protein [Flavonifractor sp. An306]|uniref:hypothetical protein n=1 Tax=Flavonifractor sp. An306 TaxID=1965629 RepID=UPI000B365A22|nr:hypothetical protein [Flavonifractor sp. An306]OUO37877.1 hypothetical protein B5F88_12105 [Flavonifractor sp. An306]
MKNQEIRRAAVASSVKLWRIADALGITDSSFSRKLRKELPQEEKEKIFSIIQQLAKEVM